MDSQMGALFILLGCCCCFPLLPRPVSATAAAMQFPQPKIWWAKRITEDIYTAGRLTERQIKYAGEAGFRSLVSMFSITENRTLGEETVPNHETEEYLATRFAGMHYATVLREGWAWKNASVTRRVAEILAAAPAPILFHCEVSFSATFHALGSLALRTTGNATTTTGQAAVITAADWLTRGAQLGYDYAADPELRAIAAEITGEEEEGIAAIPPPVVSITDFQNTFWHLKPVYDNWYVAGQVQQNHLELIAASDPDVNIVITRYGDTTGGDSQREEVTLLNIADDTGDSRQTEERLLATRLLPSIPDAYVAWDSDVNYESRNPLEFGDDVGFNLTKMAGDVKWKINHTPFGKLGENFTGEGEVRTEDCWKTYQEIWSRLEGNIIVIGRDGTNPLIAALLGAGTQNGFPASWALSRAADLGYDFTTTRPEVVALFTEVLGENTSSGASTLAPFIFMWK